MIFVGTFSSQSDSLFFWLYLLGTRPPGHDSTTNIQVLLLVGQERFRHPYQSERGGGATVVIVPCGTGRKYHDDSIFGGWPQTTLSARLKWQFHALIVVRRSNGKSQRLRRHRTRKGVGCWQPVRVSWLLIRSRSTDETRCFDTTTSDDLHRLVPVSGCVYGIALSKFFKKKESKHHLERSYDSIVVVLTG